MAPGAEISLACTDTGPDSVAAVSFAQSQGAEIISRSLGEAGAMRGDGTAATGTDLAAQNAKAAGILWVNSAGNYARSHWMGSFVDGDSDNFMSFLGADEINNLVMGAGQNQCFRLKWDDWPVTDIDLNLQLRPASDPSMVVASGSTVQNGSQPPREGFCYTNPGPTATFGLSVQRISGPTPIPRIDVFALDAFAPGRFGGARSVRPVKD